MTSSLSVVGGRVSLQSTTNTNSFPDGDNKEHTNNALDFIGSDESVKTLFTLPYTPDTPISVAIHNSDGTLLVESDPDLEKNILSAYHAFENDYGVDRHVATKHLEQNKDDDEDDSKKALVALSDFKCSSESLTVLNDLLKYHVTEKGIDLTQNNTPQDLTELLNVPPPDSYLQDYVQLPSVPREFVSWYFHGMKLMVGSNAKVIKSHDASTAITIRVEETSTMKSILDSHKNATRTGTFVPDFRHALQQQFGKSSCADATRAKDAVAKSRESKDTNKDNKHTSYPFAAPNLNEVKLQTCIVPITHFYDEIGFSRSSVDETSESVSARPVSAVSAVLDVYLDNIMTSVPQLALCLKDKGFVQSVKLLETKSIPSSFMQDTTFNIAVPFSVVENSPESEKLFSPEIMEMNAATLLKFLKNQCSKNNSTYLLRRDAGQTNIQLYDISSVPVQRQREWTWWLAMMSCRFAQRLKQLSHSTKEASLRRNFRSRERYLLNNSLELLELLKDLDGRSHESLVASIRESLADSFLSCKDGDESPTVDFKVNIPSSQEAYGPRKQPYIGLTANTLSKAMENLEQGIKSLNKLLVAPNTNDNNLAGQASSNKSSLGGEQDRSKNSSVQNVAISTQIFGLYYKIVSVALQLAEIHLSSYFCSSAMQSLRTAARNLAGAGSIFIKLRTKLTSVEDLKAWKRSLCMHYVWLWDLCGHFARSYAADENWRDRGHASGDDVVCLLRDVDSVFTVMLRTQIIMSDRYETISKRTNGRVSFVSLSGIVDLQSFQKHYSFDMSRYDEVAIKTAVDCLERRHLLERDKRKVLVASCIAYDCALSTVRNDEFSSKNIATDSLQDFLLKRMGDACNEIGKLLLNELRILLTLDLKDSKNAKLVAALPLLCSAEFWFIEGLTLFEECRDLRNIALLRCNLCQCYKLRANSMFDYKSSSGDQASKHAENCLQEAANQLQAAHVALDVRATDPQCWDMVSSELAATYLVLGVRRRQTLLGTGAISVVGNIIRLSPGEERSIVDPIQKALSIYKLSNNEHQVAAVHYQLALFYSKIWTCQRDESKTREKLSLAFFHFGEAYGYFSRVIRGNEVTFCLLSLDISSLYTSLSGEQGLSHALERCLDTADAFSQQSIDLAMSKLLNRHEWFEQMITIADSVEERLFKCLRNLVKESETSNMARFKNLFRTALIAKREANNTSEPSLQDERLTSIIKKLLSLHELLSKLRNEYKDELQVDGR